MVYSSMVPTDTVQTRRGVYLQTVTVPTPRRRASLTGDGARTLVYTRVLLSRVDFGNAVLIGLAANLLRRVQSVKNAAARLIYRLRRSDHNFTDAVVNLHWLRVAERVEFKTTVLVYKVLHRQAPRYLGPLTRVADLPGRPALRSTVSNRLHVPYVRRQPGLPGRRTSSLEQST